jgi:hypothetical protein
MLVTFDISEASLLPMTSAIISITIVKTILSGANVIKLFTAAIYEFS